MRGVIISADTPDTILFAPQQGPPGPPGTSTEGGGYLHTQTSASTTWTINHNLGFKPAIELLDAGGGEFDADIVHTSVNQAIVYCNPAAAGVARCT